MPFQDLIWGNGIVLPGFMLIVILLIRCFYNKGLVYPLEYPISKVIYHLAGLIFINDSKFNIMNNREEFTIVIMNRA